MKLGFFSHGDRLLLGFRSLLGPDRGRGACERVVVHVP